MGGFHKTITILSQLTLVLCANGALGEPAWPGDAPAGAITRASGRVVLQRMGAGAGAEAKQDMDVFVGDKLITRQGGRAQLTLRDGSFLELGENTMVRINQYSYDEGERRRTARVSVLGGAVRTVLFEALSPDSFFYLEAGPAALTSWQRAIAIVRVNDDETEVTVLRDGVQVGNVHPYVVGSWEVARGMKTTVRSGTPPLTPRSLSREEWKRAAKEFE